MTTKIQTTTYDYAACLDAVRTLSQKHNLPKTKTKKSKRKPKRIRTPVEILGWKSNPYVLKILNKK